MDQPLIQFDNVHKRFGNLGVLNGIDLSIFEGEVTTIIGKSGTGKSVLLKHIIGLLQPDTGQVRIDGEALGDMKKEQKRALKKRLSYMFQGNALFDSMTVLENIALPLLEKSTLPKTDIFQKVQAKMEQLDLHDIENKYPSQLSGGMKKRVALARALITEPEIILFDEPTTGLDPVRKNSVHNMIADYQKEFGFTGVLVSHEIPDVFFISQRIAMLDQGRIIFEGHPREIQHSDDPVLRKFIQGLESDQDDQTGMPAPSKGREAFETELERLRQHEISFTMVLLSVANLEEINANQGHAVGQKVLQNMATAIQQSIGSTDSCSRVGMNQIMILLSASDLPRAREFCAELVRDIESRRAFQFEDQAQFCVTVNVGYVEVQRDSVLQEMLIKAESRQDMLHDFMIC